MCYAATASLLHCRQINSTRHSPSTSLGKCGGLRQRTGAEDDIVQKVHCSIFHSKLAVPRSRLDQQTITPDFTSSTERSDHQRAASYWVLCCLVEPTKCHLCASA